jgi:arginyl-tRNA--protein-N-Asp/Glu arginylyltransferase
VYLYTFISIHTSADPAETSKSNPNTNSKKMKKNDQTISEKNSKINEISGDIIPPLHTLTFETSSAENTAERYELYKKYQINIHGDKPEKITKKGFQVRFDCIYMYVCLCKYIHMKHAHRYIPNSDDTEAIYVFRFLLTHVHIMFRCINI